MIADSDNRMDKARRIEQNVYRTRKLKIHKKIFLIGRGKLGEEKRQRVDELLGIRVSRDFIEPRRK